MMLMPRAQRRNGLVRLVRVASNNRQGLAISGLGAEALAKQMLPLQVLRDQPLKTKTFGDGRHVVVSVLCRKVMLGLMSALLLLVRS